MPYYQRCGAFFFRWRAIIGLAGSDIDDQLTELARVARALETTGCHGHEGRNWVDFAAARSRRNARALVLMPESKGPGPIDQRSVIRAGLLVMLTSGSHQFVGSSHGLDGGTHPLIVGGHG